MKLPGSAEQRLVMLIGLLQFTSSMVFSMVTALAPMFSRDLGIPSQQIGTIAGSYMLSSAMSGFLGTFYLDRFDRRRALAVSFSGMVVGVLLSGFAPDFHLLVASRIMTGVFAGPSSALAIAIVIDNVPLERRGRALATATTFQALAQIVGVPAGLAVAESFDTWRAPFIGMGIFAAFLAVMVITNLKPQRAHLTAGRFVTRERLRLMGRLLMRPVSLVAFGLMLTGIVPLVALTTIMAQFVVMNLGYPQQNLKVLFLVGGLANFVMSYFIGRMVDRFGAGIVAVGSTVLLSFAILAGYLGYNPGLPLEAVFSLFFVTSSARLVVSQTTTLRIPRPEERAGFQSLMQAIQAASMGLSALAIPVLVGSTPDGRYTGIAPFAYGVIVITWIFPVLIYVLHGLLTRRDREVAADQAAAAA